MILHIEGNLYSTKNQAGKRVLDHAGVAAPTRRYGLDIYRRACVSPEVLDHFYVEIDYLSCVSDFTRRDGDGKRAIRASDMVRLLPAHSSRNTRMVGLLL